MNKKQFYSILPTVLYSCTTMGNEPPEAIEAANNILLIIADDVGKDALRIYSEKNLTANTPHIDQLAQSGVRFENFWTSSLSSPTRAMILTGQYGFRSEVVTTTPSLSSDVITLQDMINDDYSNGFFGKWHLSKNLSQPSDYGIGHFGGYMGGGLHSYTDWTAYINGVAEDQNVYAPTQITNWALEWIQQQEQPWLCWLAYPSAHTPYHKPPESDLPEYDANSDNGTYFRAMIEAMDTEIGRLLANIDMSKTTVIFIGDNGTERSVSQGISGGKGTLYEGGICNPLIISGACVDTKLAINRDLVCATDLMPTIVELTGEQLGEYQDGISIMNLIKEGSAATRKWLFTDVVSPRTGYGNAISDGTYKLISNKGVASALYHLQSDPNEQANIINKDSDSEAQAALKTLQHVIDSLRIPSHITDMQTNMRSRQRRAIHTF